MLYYYKGDIMISVNKLRDSAFMIINNIAFLTSVSGENRVLVAVDLNNRGNTATFSYNSSNGHFFVIESSFPEGKRKYEMLYFVERNTKKIAEVLLNA